MLSESAVYRKENVFTKSFVFKLAVIFVLSIFIPFLNKNNVSLLIVLPFVALFFYLGNYEAIASICGLFIGAGIYSFYYFILSAAMIILFFVFLLISRITKLDMKIRILCSVFLSDLIIRLYYFYGNEIDKILFSLIVVFITYMLLKYTKYLFSSRKFYEPYLLVILGILMCLYLCLLPSSFPIDYVKILMFLLMITSIFLLGKAEGVISVIGILVLNNYFKENINNTWITFAISLIILINIFNKKHELVLFTLLINGLYLFSIKETIFPYIELIISLILFALIPCKLLNRIKRILYSNKDLLIEQERKYKNLHKKIESKLDNLSLNYQQLKENLLKDNDSSIEENRIKVMFKDMCLLCPKKEECHDKKSNKLEKIAKTLLNQNLSNDEQLYVEKNCLKSKYFLENGYEQRIYLETERKYEKDIKALQVALKENLNGMSEVMTSLKDTLIKEAGVYESGNEKLIKQKLEQLRYDVIYINYLNDDLSKTRLEIGLRYCSKHQIENEIKNIIENILETPLKIEKLSEVNYEDYYKIVYVSDNRYLLTYGVCQLSKDHLVCGDTSAVFESNDHKYFVISDGMGFGIKAKEESKSTINSFKKIIETGVTPSTAIKTINSILKVKHKSDMFSTLDILKIHSSNYKATITKTCAPATYYFSDNKVEVIDSYSLPIGIVDDVETYDEVLEIKKGDIFLMASDGFTMLKEDIEQILIEYKDKNAQEIVDYFISFYNRESLLDDLTLLLIKVI